MKKKKTLLTGEPKNPALVVGLRTITDHERLLDAVALKDFLKVLKDILPYWKQKRVRYKFEADSMLMMIRAIIVYRRELSSKDLPPAPVDFIGVDDWIVSVEKLLKRKPKKDIGINAEAKLMGVLFQYANKRPSIALLAREAGVSRKTANKCPLFLSTYYQSVRPKIERK